MSSEQYAGGGKTCPAWNLLSGRQECTGNEQAGKLYFPPFLPDVSHSLKMLNRQLQT
jgi:hypothetical protein